VVGQSKTCLSGKTSSVTMADHALMFSTHENQEYCSMWSVMAYRRCLRKLFPESFLLPPDKTGLNNGKILEIIFSSIVGKP
jgi:hypothetical protein